MYIFSEWISRWVDICWFLRRKWPKKWLRGRPTTDYNGIKFLGYFEIEIFLQGDAEGNLRIIMNSGVKELLLVCGFITLNNQQKCQIKAMLQVLAVRVLSHWASMLMFASVFASNFNIVPSVMLTWCREWAWNLFFAFKFHYYCFSNFRKRKCRCGRQVWMGLKSRF